MKSGVRAIDFMSSNVITTTKEKTVAHVAKTLNKYRIGGMPVINVKGRVVGMITERDIMRKVIALDKKPSNVKVGEIMTKKLVKIEKFEDMNDIAKKMKKYDITRLPVVHEKKLIGIITNRDVLEQSPHLVDLILEQARIKGPRDEEHMPHAIGKCEFCGSGGNLTFNKDMFMCESCV